ncbi:MAG TPA: ATP-binding cassette domain-containing protein [Nitrospiria bacterium]|nr:ATP-binding cassette domain-containing protein [Nitrospiria bacterium]
MSSPIIQAERLSKVYPGGRTALSAMDLSVAEGEILGFLGPNGAGKTSTIKILTTLSRPSSGTASVAGFDVVHDPAAVRRVIGYVAQEAGVDYFLTGRENLVLQGRLYHLDSRIIAERTQELLALFDIESVADQLVSSYSGGTKRKLDIATALLHRPKVLFLDEPTLGLDLQSRHALWDYIRRLNASDGMTIFLTTHYLEEADKLAHRVAIVDQGGVKAVGTPEALKDGVGGDAIRLTFEGGAPGPSVWQVLKSHPLVNDVVADGDSLHVVVKEGREALPKLLPALDAAQAGIRSITLSRPSLDDVFLKHTGKAFSSESASSGGEAWWAKWQKGGGSWGNKQWSESSTDEKGAAGPGRTPEPAAASETEKSNSSGAPAWKQWSGESSENGQGNWNGTGHGQGSGSGSWPQQTWDKDKGR